MLSTKHLNIKNDIIPVLHTGLFYHKIPWLSLIWPCWDHDSQIFFDGKVGTWPFTKYEPAKRNSKHRLKETIVTKPLPSMDKDVVKEMIIKNVLSGGWGFGTGIRTIFLGSGLSKMIMAWPFLGSSLHFFCYSTLLFVNSTWIRSIVRHHKPILIGTSLHIFYIPTFM